MNLFKALFGNYSEKEIKRILPLQTKVLALEEEYKALSDEALKAKTAEFKERLIKGETLDDILPEAFALVREADDRVLGKRPFYVQLLGGMLLHQGRIAEMKTGEGKTLTATLPVFLNALTGNGVACYRVNDEESMLRAVDSLLWEPVAKTGSIQDRKIPASWACHVGGQADEA